jgi:hypothetical protein
MNTAKSILGKGYLKEAIRSAFFYPRITFCVFQSENHSPEAASRRIPMSLARTQMPVSWEKKRQHEFMSAGVTSHTILLRAAEQSSSIRKNTWVHHANFLTINA